MLIIDRGKSVCIRLAMQSSTPMHTAINANTTAGLRWRNDCFQGSEVAVTFTFAFAKQTDIRLRINPPLLRSLGDE